MKRVVNQLRGADAGDIKLLEPAELRQLLDRVRQQVNADAEFAHVGRVLEEFDLNAPFGQAERGRKAADAAAIHECPQCGQLGASRPFEFRPQEPVGMAPALI